MSDEPKTSLFEVFVAILLGLGAVGGGWAAYQASQWGSTATENYGKSSTTATRGATLFNVGLTIGVRDAQLDLKGKELVVHALTTPATDTVSRTRDLLVAKYLYTMQMSPVGYQALGYPPEFYPKDHSRAEKDKANGLPDQALIAGLERELEDAYWKTVTANGTQLFDEAKTTFQEGQRVSGVSTKFGQIGMLFTITLFLGGMAMVFKSRMRWGFLGAGYVTLAASAAMLFLQPWYPA
jgi:hypothetical protein